MTDHDTLRAASENDSYVVRKLLVEARAAASCDERLLCAAALPVLEGVLEPALCGTLPRSEWRDRISRGLDEMVPLDTPLPPPMHSISALLKILESAVPANAHERRVAQVLDSDALSRTEDPRTRAPILLQLLRGAVTADSASPRSSSSSPVTPLQCRILARISDISQPPLGLSGLVQTPLLDELRQRALTTGGGLAATLGAASGGDDAHAPALFLAAAELARRGDQRGSKHGCLLVVEEGETEGVEEADGAPTECVACADDETRPISDSDSQVADHEAAAVARVLQSLDSHSGSGGPLTRVSLGSGRWARVLGGGFNHSVSDKRGGGGRSRVLHAECHAIAAAMASHGETSARKWLKGATAVIVELVDDVGYDDAPPCRKCACLLRAVGVTAARHSTREGTLRHLCLPSHAPHLLRVGMACKPLAYALDEVGVRCEWLEAALRGDAAKDGHAPVDPSLVSSLGSKCSVVEQ